MKTIFLDVQNNEEKIISLSWWNDFYLYSQALKQNSTISAAINFRRPAKRFALILEYAY